MKRSRRSAPSSGLVVKEEESQRPTRSRKSALAANNDEPEPEPESNDGVRDGVEGEIPNDKFASLCAHPTHLEIPPIEIRANVASKWDKLPEGTRKLITKACTRLLLMKG